MALARESSKMAAPCGGAARRRLGFGPPNPPQMPRQGESTMRLRKHLAMATLLVCGVGAAAVALAAAPPAYDPIATRQNGQLLVLGSFRGILQAVQHKLPVKPFAEPATAIAKWMVTYPSL
ncbi:MAG: hypothetical protein KGI51_07335, partial [Rhodospirillales bacterium]|nr:hypothetical protein [Rhodospirillales bacterium]